MEAPLFFLKRTGRRAARYIKKKGARRARTKELALYKFEHRSSQKEENRPAKTEETKTKQTPVKPRAQSSVWRPPPSSYSLGP